MTPEREEHLLTTVETLMCEGEIEGFLGQLSVQKEQMSARLLSAVMARKEKVQRNKR